MVETRRHSYLNRVRFEDNQCKCIDNTFTLQVDQISWQLLIDSIDQFSDDFMEEREQPAPKEREALFD